MDVSVMITVIAILLTVGGVVAISQFIKAIRLWLWGGSGSDSGSCSSLFEPICSLSKRKPVVLGEAVASDDDDLILPNQKFAKQAHVPSFQKVTVRPRFVC
ncbi:hypothetical protein HanOQP8_Chr07g0258871 [Helianthus annuus]|nr:hypothetical protein HanIR_Chr07g0330781 [Helianthus annuus]KAJ0732055.1 hypothetical protein HanOQP8_Chr07g0258871 [Helianthus annuus]